MFNENFDLKQYESFDYDNLKHAYKEAFNREFLEKDHYERRFKAGKYFSSFLILERKTQKIVGHTGFKISNLNPKIKGKIAFRYSTFIAKDFRGNGIYSYLMNYACKELKINFNVKFIFAWPNKINLISCLKDSKYINLDPIITWQLNLDDFIQKVNWKNELPNINYTFISLKDSKFDFDISHRENYLTYESSNDLKSILFERDNKKYFYIAYENMYSIIGYSILNKTKYLSIILNRGFEINLLLSIIKLYFKGNNFIVQLWCDKSDRYLLRSILKENFIPNGPIFFNGVYELTGDEFPKELLIAMYNHDAF